MIHKGYFLISDITGYTAFLTQTELDHAQEILGGLMNTMVEHTRPPLVISNFQGDAIFSYAPEGSFVRGQTLIEMAEKIYCAFAGRQEEMVLNTTCTCRACANIGSLDLKLFIHYGDYVIQEIGGKQELNGADVVLVHRMMKNDVREQTGLRAYALVTEAAIEAAELRELCDDMPAYVNEYEHLGQVKMYAQDLRAAWEREREARQIFVKPEDAWIAVETDLPVPPALAWDFLNDSRYKKYWLGVNASNRIDDLGGRIREGSRFHCAHNSGDVFYTIVGWHPFESLTWDTIGANGIKYYTTYHVDAVGDGSRVRTYSSRPSTDELPPEMLEQMRSMIAAGMQAGAVRLRELVEEELAAGNIVAAGAEVAA